MGGGHETREWALGEGRTMPRKVFALTDCHGEEDPNGWERNEKPLRGLMARLPSVGARQAKSIDRRWERDRTSDDHATRLKAILRSSQERGNCRPELLMVHGMAGSSIKAM